VENLPPLNTLRSFEAAARHLSFNGAASELHVTPSAVSHAIKSLEEFLGLALFERAGRGVTLTPDGKIFLTPIRDALSNISHAAQALRRQRENHPLTITSAPALIVGWLMQRLAKFQLAWPDIEVRLTSSPEVIDLRQSDIDMAIRSGDGHWSGLTSHFLMSEELVAVCKPDMAEQLRSDGRCDPQNLVNVPLIHVMPTMGQWRSWLNTLGVQHPDPERGPKFESSPIAVEAAIGGLGVALVPASFVEDHVAAGRLIRPFDVDIPDRYNFYLVYASEHADIPRIAAFRDWILAEVEA